MKKKLLIPLDGSEFSKTILEHVIQLFKPDEAEIFLLRVTEVPKEEHESFTRMMGGWGVLIDWAPLVSQELRSELDDKQAEHITYFEKELSDEEKKVLQSHFRQKAFKLLCLSLI